MKSFSEWLSKIEEQEIAVTPTQVNTAADSLGGIVKHLPDAPGGTASWWQRLLNALGAANPQVQQGVTQAAATQTMAKSKTTTPSTTATPAPTQSVR